VTICRCRSSISRAELPEPTFAMIIPASRRDNFKEVIAGLMWQSIAPTRIVILQNMTKKIIDFEAIRQATRVPLHHVWATNWNMSLYLTYVVMMFMPEPYSLKIDDDQVPAGNYFIVRSSKTLEGHPNSLVGLVDFKASKALYRIHFVTGIRTDVEDKKAYCGDDWDEVDGSDDAVIKGKVTNGEYSMV
jgi:hypothetical protein